MIFPAKAAIDSASRLTAASNHSQCGWRSDRIAGTNVPRDTTTKTTKGKAGSYAFGLKGLKHSEQYQVRHKTQRVNGTTYKATKGKTITIRP